MLVFSCVGFDYYPLEGIQIHNIDRSHWVVSSSFGGKIRVYDSLMKDGPSEDLKRQINQLYSPDETDISFEITRCQQQLGLNDCGLFAIANVAELLEGSNLDYVLFDQYKMRDHLIDCFEKGEILPFPKRRITRDSKAQSQKVQGVWKSPRKTKKQPIMVGSSLEISNPYASLSEEEAQSKVRRMKKRRLDRKRMKGVRKMSNKKLSGNLEILF